MNAALNSEKRLIIGLGVTGLSVARWCVRNDVAFDLCDTRQLTNGAQLAEEFPQADIFCGPFDAALLCQYQEIIVSPGIPLAEPALAEAIAKGIKVRGDVDIFAEHCSAPIVAITGSNGKTTVTSLVGALLNSTGLQVAVGGNIGIPVLDLPPADIYVLELSSFQLETTSHLNAAVATILNISEDHLDRYVDIHGYISAKKRIYQGAQALVINRDEAILQTAEFSEALTFGLSAPKTGEFGLVAQNQQTFLAYGSEMLLATSDLKIKGLHNIANALSALAIVEALPASLWPKQQAPWAQVLDALTQFQGLEYRCQWLGEKHGVNFYNDSKGTNVGSTLAAINGLGAELEGKIWLLAGGVGKGQDFKPLAPACAEQVAAVLYFGRDGEKIAQAVEGACSTHGFDTVDEALAAAVQSAQADDIILFSPACASFDQFANFEERGQYFTRLVEALL